MGSESEEGGGVSIAGALDVARSAARVGGEVLSHYFHNGVEMRYKESYNLVSDADLDAERAVAQVILNAYPDHAILAEELHSADPGAEHLWVVDPLDGTNNFAHGISHFAVSIAYYRRGEPVCGVIHNPITDEWYSASRGGGAFFGERRARVSGESALDQTMVGVGFYYDRGKMMEATLAAIGDFFRRDIHGIRRFGTASLDLCNVGLGKFGVFFEYNLSPWDFAAGALFVAEAGGTITDCAGAPLPLARTSVLATNGTLHPAALEIARRHLP